ncbi:ABC transporter permease [Cesiribacter andamanensis]|uniref:Lipoprotein-releasing system transmembrane protein lolE n=1 Tax=Cesiribacter andamanensis AMV16 TaxID=1279009 RepID=M7N440_9BACT|nr:FtsX-like permease family protein [Cesiribacter andamanensis]EMR01981.1 Lipoprotein-releasing system transmembrane protein lolE [Cesiribacter andamanensis AMV16]
MLYPKIAWRNLWRNRRRTLITISSVVGAVLLAILMQSMQYGSYERMIHNVSGFFIGAMQVQQQDYWQEQTVDNSLPASEALQQQLAGLRNVAVVAPRLQTYALAAGREKSRAALVLGIDPEQEKGLMQPQNKLVAGSYFSGANEQAVLLGRGLAEYLGLQPGDSLVLLGGGYQGSSAAGKYLIKGLVSYGLPEINNNMLFLPLGSMQAFLAAPERLTAYAISVDKINRLPSTESEVREVLPAGLQVMSWSAMMPELVQAIEADAAGNIIMLAVLYMVVGFGILGTVLMMTAERRYEFGVLLSIGMPRATLALTVLLELLLIALIGVVIGALLAIPIVLYFHHNPLELSGAAAQAIEEMGWEAVVPFSTDPSLFLWQACIILALTLLLAFYPMLHIFRLNPVQSMRE